mgnify:CR=1 FL=1
MGRRIITTENLEEDQKIENHLRPQTLDDYVGQEKAKEMLKIYISAAKDRGEPLDHVLFYGPPGLGKTTLAGIIANEMGVNLKVTSGPAIEKPGEVAPEEVVEDKPLVKVELTIPKDAIEASQQQAGIVENGKVNISVTTFVPAPEEADKPFAWNP